MTHKMTLQPSPFEAIKAGTKTIELRLYDEKRKRIAPGDEIVFTEAESGEEMTAKVVELYVFDSFDELYASLALTECGYTAENASSASPEDMEAYYTKEEQKKHKVVGIRISLK